MVYSDNDISPENANSFAPVEKTYTDMLDDLFAQESKTTMWTPNPALVQGFQGSATGKIATIFTSGMGDYSATKGYVIGKSETKLVPYTLSKNRAVQHRVDGVDLKKAGNIPTASAILAEFSRMHVIPEIDATRISAVYSRVHTVDATHAPEGSATNKSNILDKIRDGLNMIEDETGIDSGMTILLNTKYKPALNKADGITVTRDVSGDGKTFNNKVMSIDDNIIKSCPSARMWSEFEFSTDPVTDGVMAGFKPASGSKEIVAVITAPDTAQGIVAHEVTRIFGPEQVQDFDGSKINYHVYHDCIVPEHKVPGCYIITSEKTTVRSAEAVQAAQAPAPASKKKN